MRGQPHRWPHPASDSNAAPSQPRQCFLVQHLIFEVGYMNISSSSGERLNKTKGYLFYLTNMTTEPKLKITPKTNPPKKKFNKKIFKNLVLLHYFIFVFSYNYFTFVVLVLYIESWKRLYHSVIKVGGICFLLPCTALQIYGF